MKIYNWIDSLFDTKEKRQKWILWITSLYLIWQLVWLDVFFYQLVKVKDYDTLFTFMGSMNAYSNSVLIRVVFGLISGNHIDFISMIKAIFNNVYLFDYIMGFLCMLVLWARKKGLIAGIASCCYGIFLCIILFMGLKSSSVMYLLTLLGVLSYVSLVLFIGCTLYLLYRIVKSIYSLYEI